MILSDAINLRITELLKEHNLTAYKLSYKAGISNSIISDCKRGKVKEPTISSIIHICEGLNIKLKDFFDCEYFKDVEAIDRNEKNSKKVVWQANFVLFYINHKTLKSIISIRNYAFYIPEY